MTDDALDPSALGPPPSRPRNELVRQSSPDSEEKRAPEPAPVVVTGMRRISPPEGTAQGSAELPPSESTLMRDKLPSQGDVRVTTVSQLPPAPVSRRESQPSFSSIWGHSAESPASSRRGSDPTIPSSRRGSHPSLSAIGVNAGDRETIPSSRRASQGSIHALRASSPDRDPISRRGSQPSFSALGASADADVPPPISRQSIPSFHDIATGDPAPWFDWASIRERLRPLPLLVAGAWLLQRSDGAPLTARAETDLGRALVVALAERGLKADPSDVHLISPARTMFRSPVSRPRAVVRAVHDNEPADIYLVETRVSPEGNLIEITAAHNLTDTSAADERTLIVSGERAAWTIAQDGATSSVQFADFVGEPPQTTWNRLARIQNAITNLQETGQRSGIGRRAFKLDPAAYKVVLGFSQDALLVDADSHKIRVPTAERGAFEGAQFIKEQTPPKPKPGNLVTWAVDRVRASPWFGDDRMQWLKAVAFDGADQMQQIVSTVTGDDGSETVKEELGDLFAAPTAETTDPVSGWPPAPMEPMLSTPIKGEGKWVSLEKDPFVAKNPGAPSPFVLSFIRTDRKRIYTQIFVLLWDPRQIELHAMSGTVEPKSATGETGPGLVPRKPEVMSRFVAGFNGGFQAMHGEFGMTSDRVVYLPPKPFAATVAELEDGSTGFGTWPEDLTVPPNIVSLRQNMTPLMAEGKINPYKRHWWGGLPPGWTEESRTVRTGLCMTKEGFVGYFYGASIDPDVLALAMQRARCNYGIHLDMNPGHTGLEFYRAAPKGELPKLGRALEESWEAKGKVPGMPGWEFMGRRMIKYMALMNFPRYVSPEARDFFYLTLRHVLPGDPVPTAVTPAEPGEGTWRVQGLPQHGWPYAVATTSLRPVAEEPELRVGLIKVDPKYVRVRQASDTGTKTVIEFKGAISDLKSKVALWHSETLGFSIGPSAPEPKAIRVTGGLAGDDPAASVSSAAIGIDEAGMLVYARPTTNTPQGGGYAAALRKSLTQLGCKNMLFFRQPLGVVLGDQNAAQTPESVETKPGSGVVLVRRAGPGATQIFPDTPIVKPQHWAPLQQKRVRYR